MAEGNMVLIKDRHHFLSILQFYSLNFGKYGTYKGSTLKNKLITSTLQFLGKYGTYKGSTQGEMVELDDMYMWEI